MNGATATTARMKKSQVFLALLKARTRALPRVHFTSASSTSVSSLRSTLAAICASSVLAERLERRRLHTETPSAARAAETNEYAANIQSRHMETYSTTDAKLRLSSFAPLDHRVI